MRGPVLLTALTLFYGTAIAGPNPQLVNFAPHMDFPVGSSPIAIVTADFDHDGHADVAVANNESDNVSVLLGNGSGGFTAAGPFSGAGGPSALAVGDFDKDTNLDLVVTADVDNKVSVLLGNGNGTFGAAQSIDVGTSPEGIAVGDFNNDGNPDFANTNYFDSPATVTVLLGNGDGTFQSPSISIAVDGGPIAVAVGRLNNDGNDDLVVGGYDAGIVFILLGNGDGTFQNPTTHAAGLLPSAIVIRDLNADSNLDLAVANEDSDSVSVLLGDGNGGFAAAVQYAVGSLPEGIAAADFNGDGIVDLVTADYFGTVDFDNSISVLIGIGDGTFVSAQSFETHLSPFGVVAADFGGDSLPDVATVNLDSNDVSLLLNETNQPATTMTPTPTSTATPTSPGSCPVTPVSGCRTPVGFSRALRISTKDMVTWSWRTQGNIDLAEFGDPVNTTSYALCIYAGTSPTRIMELRAPVGGICPTGKPCWESKGPKGFRYNDKDGTPNGIKHLRLRASPAALADIALSAQGPHVPMPSLPLSGTVIAQLIKSDGLACWQSNYSSPAKKNTSNTYLDKND